MLGSNDDECELCVCVKDAPAGRRSALMESNSISEYGVWCVTKPSSSTHPKRAKLAQKKWARYVAIYGHRQWKSQKAVDKRELGVSERRLT